MSCVISWNHSEQNVLHSFCVCVIWWLVMIFISKPHQRLLIACLLFVCMYVLLSISNTLHQMDTDLEQQGRLEGEQEKAVFNPFPVLRTFCDTTDTAFAPFRSYDILVQILRVFSCGGKNIFGLHRLFLRPFLGGTRISSTNSLMRHYCPWMG